jgi:shikimate dehydrogenase/3-dehydroquinate dehydratase type I
MICIPVTSHSNEEALRAIARSIPHADFIELRIDLIGDGNLAELISAAHRQSASVKVIITCRKKEEATRGGISAMPAHAPVITAKEKMALLKEAITLGADFVDIELAEGKRAIHELQSLCAESGGKTKLIISYHNLKETPRFAKLRAIFNQCAKFDPAVVKIITTARNAEDNLVTLNLIPFARRHSRNIIAFCMGDKGLLSRAVAPLLGSYLSFAALEKERRSAPGQFMVREMKSIRKLFGDKQREPLPSTSFFQRSTPQNFVLLGNPVGHSLSPLMHNKALKKMGFDENYSAFCVQDIGRAAEGIRGMNIRGASVTIPFKETVMQYLDDIDDDALALGAVNTIVNNNGCLAGYNTDWLGLMLTLKKAMTIKNKTFAVIGAGGTARAAVYGILKEGGIPMIFNRTPEKGKKLAEEFNISFHSLSAIKKFKAECLINTTSVGMFPHADKAPVKMTALAGYKYVMDVIYNPLKTKLLSDAEKHGCRILSGLDMFVHQGAEQLRLWTGKEPPRALMKNVILKRLTAK